MYYHIQTNTGTVKKINQDSAMAAYNQKGVFLAIVADGVSSQPASEIASQLVVENITKIWQKTTITTEKDAKRFLMAVTEHENNTLLAIGEKQPKLMHMATTMVIAVVLEGCVVVANLGDSKALLWQKGHLHQLSYDHNVANELIRLGKAASTSSPNIKNGKMITRYMGLDKHVGMDMMAHDFELNDILMLTTDGLPNALGLAKIQMILSRVHSLTETNDELIRLANQSHATDNLTSLLISRNKD